ncbi:DUF493 domain-containing protein [Campylobacter blaseri]|uniref:DUF493 domain-containing protein n=1 Tax=Campylobacter blaseri TaxID=2042961 RepID=A0A2P8R3V9_9BACT|nr:DUF493 domain-containing protein [Campylobacter blaseri]PSM53194.1 DUF493 domain-containing protein [Campylobacter blaseri]PSM54660.1 DUF493 domain-containing protein [Campylobacter blaseri]QKF86863.1 DUF493 domain-containing protein [Campylobacter blaseri]
MNICDLSNKKPNIDYPVHWSYKVLVDASEDINLKVENILNDLKYEINPSKDSSSGKYKSYNIKVLVSSEKERLDIFNKFKNISKFVL